MKRYSAIDGFRGLIVILMVMHHSLDAWVHNPERHGWLWARLEDLGGLPAPGFLFLAGLSAALVAARERKKGLTVRQQLVIGLKRGLYVLGIAFAFRLAAFSIDVDPEWYTRYWPIIFRVDILNCMGVALAVVAVFTAFAKTPRAAIAVSLITAAAFLLPTPFFYGRLFQWPSPLIANYVSGTQPMTMFPLFPWASFAAIGYAAGEWIALYLAASQEPPNIIIARASWPLMGVGLLMFSACIWLGWAPFDLYPSHDYWHASPIYMCLRAGLQLALMGAMAQWWKTDPNGERGAFLQLLGRHSLFVYLVHIELVYGRPAWTLDRTLTLAQTLSAVGAMIAAFAVASWVMEWWKSRSARPKAARVAAPPAEAPSTESEVRV